MPKGKKVKEYSNKWYYDACTLDYNAGVYGEMIDKYHPKQIFLSHLSLGEAYGCCYEKGEEKAELFVKLIERLRKNFNNEQMKIIGNEKIQKQFDMVIQIFPELDITDAVHIATALKCECNNIRTLDRDLWGLPSLKVKKLGEEFKIDNFSITKV